MRCFVMAVLASVGCLVGGAEAQMIIAHRGASHDAPENTVAAFKLAWEQAADGIEGDFYLTKDGHIVCIHDKTTKRTAPDQEELTVADSTLAELQRLDVGRWKGAAYVRERIPTLEQVLETVPDLGIIFVEVKSGPEILPALKQKLAESGLAPQQIVIICFDEEVITQSRKMMPQYKANWLTSYKQKSKDAAWKPSQAKVLKTLTATGATGLGSQGELEVVDATFVEEVHRQGREFHVWTIDEIAPARQLQRFGVDSITTNRPAYLREGIQ